jgi:hypothetical protein
MIARYAVLDPYRLFGKVDFFGGVGGKHKISCNIRKLLWLVVWKVGGATHYTQTQSRFVRKWTQP